jgi:hypothetical protein
VEPAAAAEPAAAQIEPAAAAEQEVEEAELLAVACPAAGETVVDAQQMEGHEEQQASQQNSRSLNASPGEHECCRTFRCCSSLPQAQAAADKPGWLHCTQILCLAAPTPDP